MSDKKQSDVKQPGWLRKVWLWVKRWWLPIVILLITSAGLVCALSIPQRVFETPSNLNDRDTSTSQNPGTPDNKETSHTIQSPSNSNNRDAPVLLAQSNLRLAFLYITGGAIAVVGLIETFRKNNNEKLKNDQDKKKNDREHLRQVRAERRERYTKAVEQLGSKEAPVRMGGVYTLVGLVDEWLEEESLSENEKLKEGQVIINNLCAYIRSPFTLASYYDKLSKPSPTPKGIYKGKKEKLYADKATLESEADVRLSIIKEIHDRLQGSEENTPGTWSEFEYNFSGSRFFYSVDLTNSYYTKSVNFSGSIYSEKADFSGSTYKGEADFGGSTYQGGADFGGSTYKDKASFSESTYEKNVIFSTSNSHSTYKGKADFSGSTYRGDWVNFSDSTYEKNVIFSTSASRSTYEGPADFGGSTYEGRADFGESTYEKDATFSTSGFPSIYRGGVTFSGSTYKDEANFGGSIYKKGVIFSTSISPSTYRGGVTFSGSTYKDEANFSNSTYEKYVNALESTYWGEADFSDSIYRGDWVTFNGSTYQGKADFSGSIFCSEIYFGYSTHSDSFSCFISCTPQFYDETNRKNTLFGSPDNNFTVENGRGYPIYRNLEGLPLGCKFLTSEQKEYLEYKFQEIDETKNKLREVKDDEEKANLIKTLLSFYYDIRNWRREVITVKTEDVAAEDTES